MSQQGILEADREQILAQLATLSQAVQVEVDTDPDEGDPDLYEREKNMALIAALKSELASVESALRAIKRGTYGICERCGVVIRPERLEVRPEATFCVKCQAEVERLIRRGLMPPPTVRRDELDRLDEPY